MHEYGCRRDNMKKAQKGYKLNNGGQKRSKTFSFNFTDTTF